MIKWIKELFRIVSVFDEQYKAQNKYAQYLKQRILSAEDEIKRRTEINADVRFHGRDRNQVIVVGRYKKRDYIQVYTLPDNALITLVDQLRDMQRYGVLEKIDSPTYDFKAVVEREL